MARTAPCIGINDDPGTDMDLQGCVNNDADRAAGLGHGARYDDWMAAVSPGLLPSASYPQSPQIVGSVAARKRAVFG